MFMVVASCAVHTEGPIKCYNHHICVGDYYEYNSYKVYILAVTNTRIHIRYINNREEWVNGDDFDNHVRVVYSQHKDVHVYKNKKERDNDKEGTQGRKKVKDNPGKHKGNPHY